MTATYPNPGYGYGYSGRSPSGNRDVIRHVARTSDIVETAAAVPVIKTLVALLRETGLDYELAKSGPFTVFAPTDIAFSQLCAPHSIKMFASLLRPVDRCALKRLLSYHIVKGCIPSGVAVDSGKLVGESLAGFPLTITGYGNKMSAGSGSVVKADIPCANGVIHLISSILTPSKFVNLPEDPKNIQRYSAVLDVYSNTSDSKPPRGTEWN
jgi:uncharacterized surface protein with fasciclin (FAS1) repeats